MQQTCTRTLHCTIQSNITRKSNNILDCTYCIGAWLPNVTNKLHSARCDTRVTKWQVQRWCTKRTWRRQWICSFDIHRQLSSWLQLATWRTAAQLSRTFHRCWLCTLARLWRGCILTTATAVWKRQQLCLKVLAMQHKEITCVLHYNAVRCWYQTFGIK